MEAVGTVEVTSWAEAPYDEGEGWPQMARVEATFGFGGTIEGAGDLVYLMAYGEGGRTGFVGLQRVVGVLGGRAGSFVLEHRGYHGEGAVRGTWSVVPGTGTGELRGIGGEGDYVWDGGEGDLGRYKLAYEITGVPEAAGAEGWAAVG